jgi:hypothetical protein
MAHLEAVLSYRHPAVVARYIKDFGGDQGAAEDLFQELTRWLYLCARAARTRDRSVTISMYPEILRIDDMWHTFILHTRDYAEFCHRYFGHFIHHDPLPPRPPREWHADEANAELEMFLSFLYDELDEATVRRWFVERRYARDRDSTPPKTI